MRRGICWVFFTVAVSSAMAQEADAKAVFVDSAGSAVFRVPILVPKGAGNTSPELTLEYKSQRGNGIAGLGWAVTGVSSVTRCDKIPAEEGTRWGVMNNASDVFCLDGKKLRAFSGAYGSDGAEYRLALDNYSRIKSLGVQGGGPRSFSVESKDGRVYEFGIAEASRLEHPAKGSIRVWMLDRIKDRFGNAISFTYEKNDNLSLDHPVTLPLSDVLAQVDEAGERDKARPWSVNVFMSAVLCPAVPFTLPAGVKRWSEAMAVAQATAAAAWGLPAEQAHELVCAMDSRRTDLAAALMAGTHQQIQTWAGLHGGRLASLQPLWATATSARGCRAKTVRRVSLHEPGAVTELVDSAAAGVVALPAGSVSVRFSPQVLPHRQQWQHAPVSWAGHWESLE